MVAGVVSTYILDHSVNITDPDLIDSTGLQALDQIRKRPRQGASSEAETPSWHKRPIHFRASSARCGCARTSGPLTQLPAHAGTAVTAFIGLKGLHYLLDQFGLVFARRLGSARAIDNIHCAKPSTLSNIP
jgi:hypothetical protein